jgi:hypothetical protein
MACTNFEAEAAEVTRYATTAVVRYGRATHQQGIRQFPDPVERRRFKASSITPQTSGGSATRC